MTVPAQINRTSRRPVGDDLLGDKVNAGDHTKMPADVTETREVNFRRWLLNILAWDGVVPLSVVVMPYGLKLVLPDNPWAFVVAAVVLPIGALLARFAIGTRQIASNHCGALCRGVQYVALVVGILVLLVIDAMLVLAHDLHKGALFESGQDRAWCVILIFTYLATMTVACFPGEG